MTLRPTRHALLFAATLLVAPAMAIAAPASSTPAGAGTTTTLLDQHGKPISTKAFEAALRNGQRYVSTYRANPRGFDLKLLPPGVAPPGSFAPSDRASLKFIWMNVDGQRYVVQFHDTRGAQIGIQAFVAGASAHQRYTTHLDKATGTALLTLLPPGVRAPESHPTADWLARAGQADGDAR